MVRIAPLAVAWLLVAACDHKQSEPPNDTPPSAKAEAPQPAQLAGHDPAPTEVEPGQGVKVGTLAPPFSLTADDGSTFSWSPGEAKTRMVLVLYRGDW